MFRRPRANGDREPTRASEAIDIAARYLVYNLFVATSGARKPWRALRELGEEEAETVARAIERGWVVVFDHRQEGRAAVRAAALTDEGRRVARRSLH